MRGFSDACGVAGFAEQIAETFLGQGRAISATDEMQVSCRASFQCSGQCGMQWHRYFGFITAFLGANVDHAVFDVLLADHDRIAARIFYCTMFGLPYVKTVTKPLLGAKPRKQEVRIKADKQQRLFILISGLEEPIDHATALANAISLIAAGLRARHDNGSEAHCSD